MNKTIIFDIESASLSEAELQAVMPQFEAPSNFKDPEKIAAAIEAKRKAWIADAALDPLTGRVLAIGLLVNGEFHLISEPATEALMIQEFWTAIGPEDRLIGFNCCSFDLQFLIRRSWKLSVTVPLHIREGRYWSHQITDLREVWGLGDRQAAGSLDTIAKHLGIGAKTGNGADFAATWATDREAAIAYLRNDLSLTAGIAKRLGVM